MAMSCCQAVNGLELGLGSAVLAMLLAPPAASFRATTDTVGGGGAGCSTIAIDSTPDAQGAPAGIACAFPFLYGGSVYSTCVADDDDTLPWCATAYWNHDDADTGTLPHSWG